MIEYFTINAKKSCFAKKYDFSILVPIPFFLFLFPNFYSPSNVIVFRMKNINPEKYTIYLAIVAFLFVVGVIYWGDYLVGDYLVKTRFIEYFTLNPSITHTINLPINTDYTCKNVCGPLARCSMTGEQCATDVDCPGCDQAYNNYPKNPYITKNVAGYDNSGKLTTEMTPTFSTLVSDIGTQASLINSSAKPVQYNIGYNTWRKSFDQGTQLFNKKNDLGTLSSMPTYQKRPTLSGEFTDIGPLASNADL